ncbi:MAG: hypothetical protein AAF420_11385 [Pseudomonadota bacterium]
MSKTVTTGAPSPSVVLTEATHLKKKQQQKQRRHHPSEDDQGLDSNADDLKLDPVPKRNEFDNEDSFLAFSLVLHNLLITCSYVMVVANMTHANTVALGIFLVVLHVLLSELHLAGVRKNRPRLLLPWSLIVVVEECVLVGLAFAHLSATMATVEYGLGALFAAKGAFIIVNAIITGE